jgi:hypothetical protein
MGMLIFIKQGYPPCIKIAQTVADFIQPFALLKFLIPLSPQNKLLVKKPDIYAIPDLFNQYVGLNTPLTQANI